MTFYALILFIHIGSAFFLFAGLILECTAFSFFRRTTEPGAIQQWIRVASFSAKVYGPAIGLIILSGGYLGSVLKAWNQAWLPASFLTLVVAGLGGAAVTAPRIRILKKTDVRPGSTLTTELKMRIQDPILIASARIRVALVLGVLLLMVSKVDLRATLLIALSALVLGFVASVPLWKQRPRLAGNNGGPSATL